MLLALRGGRCRVLITKKELIKNSSFFHRVFQMLSLHEMSLQTCLCLSLTCFCRISFFLQNTPSVGGFSSPVDASCCWRVSFHGICHPDLSALSPWILSHLLQLCRVLLWSQGSISNVPVSVSTESL